MRRLWLVPALALVLSGCGSDDPRSQLRADVSDVTAAANGGNPDELREEVEDLLSTVRSLVGSRELPVAEGERITVIAQRILANADLVAPAPSPSPTELEPSPTPEPEPTEEEPEPSPTPEPEPTEEPEPSEEPEPEPSEEPEEEEEPILEITPAASQSSAPAEPSPTPGQARQQQAPSASPSP